MKNFIAEKVIALLMEQSHLNEEVSKATSLIILGIESLQFIEFLVEVENCFNIEFEEMDLDLSSYETIGDIIDIVEKKIREKEENK